MTVGVSSDICVQVKAVEVVDGDDGVSVGGTVCSSEVRSSSHQAHED